MKTKNNTGFVYGVLKSDWEIPYISYSYGSSIKPLQQKASMLFGTNNIVILKVFEVKENASSFERKLIGKCNTDEQILKYKSVSNIKFDTFRDFEHKRNIGIRLRESREEKEKERYLAYKRSVRNSSDSDTSSNV